MLKNLLVIALILHDSSEYIKTAYPSMTEKFSDLNFCVDIRDKNFDGLR